jgi:hypothetical protein
MTVTPAELRTTDRLISVAAELVRGPNLDERFDLDDRLPKWVRANIERICE